jgi:anti-anti-sigma factor
MGMSHDFQLRTDPEGVVWLSGELDMSNTDSFLQQTMGSLDGQPTAVLDLSALQFVDSTAIRAFLRLASDRAEGVVLRDPRPNVRRVLEVAGIDESMGIRIDSSS